ncbi:MAG: hypothetical protein KF757_02460 [Phycisphaeraceae bacterium]|nr:hypothetical protein [Phycisphaeraceae bacterium]MCW5762075.1 hypothetical protein [Phycisphaeraceae bacterium]
MPARITGLVVGAVLIVAGQACASVPPAGPPTVEPLAGPTVTLSDSAAPTLVRWGYDGRLVRLDGSIEEAALGLLSLSSAERSAVESVLARRTAEFDRIVLASIGPLQRLDGARVEGDSRAVGKLLGEIAGKIYPLVARGSLLNELREFLSAENANRLEGLVIEYRQALMRDERQAARRAGQAFNAIETLARLRGEELERAIERSIERSLGAEGAEFERLLQLARLKPETEQMIRVRAEEFFLAAELNPTQEQKERFVTELFLDLEREERVAVLLAWLAIQRESGMMRKP